MTKQASRVWETIIQHCPDGDAIERLYRECLAGKLADLAMHPFANFPLQRLLERCDEKALVSSALESCGFMRGFILPIPVHGRHTMYGRGQV